MHSDVAAKKTFGICSGATLSLDSETAADAMEADGKDRPMLQEVAMACANGDAILSNVSAGRMGFTAQPQGLHVVLFGKLAWGEQGPSTEGHFESSTADFILCNAWTGSMGTVLAAPLGQATAAAEQAKAKLFDMAAAGEKTIYNLG